MLGPSGEAKNAHHCKYGMYGISVLSPTNIDCVYNSY